MKYKHRDPVDGQIYKGEEPLINLRGASIRKNEELSTPSTEVLEFESSTLGIPPLEVGDKCRLVNGDEEIEVEVLSVATGGPFVQTWFRFTQPC